MEKFIKFTILVFILSTFMNKALAGGYGLANIKYAIELKTSLLEIVLSDDLNEEISNQIQSTFNEYWDYSKIVFISFNQYQKQKSEEGHFYFIGNMFNAGASYMTYGILRFREINYSQVNKDSLNGFNIIASGMAGIGAVNTLIMSPCFHTKYLIDPLNIIIMRDYLSAIWNNKDDLKTQDGIFSNSLMLKKINAASSQLNNKKLLIPLFPKTDTLKINDAGKTYNTTYLDDNYDKKIGFIKANDVNYKSLSENKEFTKSAVLINLFHFSDSNLPALDLRPVAVYDIESEKIIAFTLITSIFSLTTTDLKKINLLSEIK